MPARRTVPHGDHGWGRAAVCLYALALPFQPVLTLPDGSPLRIAAAELVAPFVLAAAVFRPRRALPSGLLALTLLVPAVALAATLNAVYDRELSGYAVGKTAGLFYLAALAVAIARAIGPGDEDAVLRALGAGALWSAVVGLAGFALALAGIPTTLVEGDRVCSTMPGDPNIFCSLLALGLLVVLADRNLSPIGRAVRVAVLAAALLASGSRSGTLAALAGILACAFLRRRDAWVTAARTTYVVLALVVAGVLAIATDTGARAAGVLWEHVWRTFTIDSRFSLYGRALDEFIEHPIAGLGIGGFNDLNTWNLWHGGEHFAVHNTYLWALVDMGVPGGVALVALIGGGIWRAVRAARRRGAPEAAAVIAAGLIAFAVFDLFIDGFYQRQFWLLVACALGLPARRPVARRPPTWEWWRRRQQTFVWTGSP